VQQHRVRVNGRTVRIDLAYPDALIAIEYDGWDFHRTRGAFDLDRARANELELLGWTVLRFTSASSDQVVVDTVRAALSRACVV
jgi:very-short-patch-repair endonuclease